MTRRVVRVLASLFEQLDLQLPSERGPEGKPTAAEFAASDLLDIVDTFAEHWDQLPTTIPGRPDYRTLVTRTRLTYAVAVRGQLSPVDSAIELIALTIDLTGLGDDNRDEGPDD
ncbi:MAG TPA: hypothetical protein VHN80_26970 [Kineosporiaceae bacterium]|nr:hypothetical protein [Kineosporiaceae bacterium]